MKLGVRQKDLLFKVCKTNGGGVFIFGGETYKIAKSLEKKGLIQGKLNDDGWAVHTKAGLDLFKILKDQGT